MGLDVGGPSAMGDRAFLLQETNAVMHINKIEVEVLNCSRSMGLLVPPTRWNWRCWICSRSLNLKA